MSVVVTRPRTERLELIWEERPGILGWLTTVDHKRIGLLYFFTTLVFFGAGGIEALLIRTQLAGPNGMLTSTLWIWRGAVSTSLPSTIDSPPSTERVNVY